MASGEWRVASGEWRVAIQIHWQLATRNSAFSFQGMEQLSLTIEGMSCEHCVRAVKNRLAATPGIEVDDVRVGSASLRYDPARMTLDQIEDVIADEGYTAFVAS